MELRGGQRIVFCVFNGNTLALVALSTGLSSSGQPYTVYGANIALYADEFGQLEFTSIAGAPHWNEFDDIAFSTTAVTPEPSIIALSAMGGLLLGGRKWFTRMDN